MFAYRLTDGLSIHTTAVCETVADRYMRNEARSAKQMHSHHKRHRHGMSSLPEPSTARHREQNSELRSDFVWLAAGRIVPAKDYENLLCAFAVCAGDPADANYGLPVKQRRASRMQQGRPRFAESPRLRTRSAGSAFAATWRRLLDAADAFVLASAWEGMPLVVGEAMAMEKSVVATDVGGVRELVGEAGMLVPAKNSDALADAMIAIMRESPEPRAPWAMPRASASCRSSDMDARADEWEALYRVFLRDPIRSPGISAW